MKSIFIIFFLSSIYLFQYGTLAAPTNEALPLPESLVPGYLPTHTNFGRATFFDKLASIVLGQVKDLTQIYPDTKEAFVQFDNQIYALTQSTLALHNEFSTVAVKQGTGLDAISDELGHLLMGVLDELKAIFPPPDQAPGHQDRQRLIHSTLEKVEDAFVALGTTYGLDSHVIQSHFGGMKPHLEALVVTMGDLIEQHPILAEAVIFLAVGHITALVLPEIWWFFRPLLNMLGFGPQGPVKGSAAAWIQRVFFGKSIPAGSWFAYLQRAGMKLLPPMAEKEIISGVGAGVGMGIGL